MLFVVVPDKSYHPTCTCQDNIEQQRTTKYGRALFCVSFSAEITAWAIDSQHALRYKITLRGIAVVFVMFFESFPAEVLCLIVLRVPKVVEG